MIRYSFRWGFVAFTGATYLVAEAFPGMPWWARGGIALGVAFVLAREEWGAENGIL